jgi:geranylgeranyl diphosphate synthase type II
LEVVSSALLEQMKKVKREVDGVIFDFLPSKNEVKEIQCLYDMMRDYPARGGKGLRPYLCTLMCEMFGGKRADCLITAAALEIFQNWILIHDDIEDNSDLRRGSPVLHKKYGVPLSINAGDSLHGKMWELLLRNQKNLPPQKCLKIYSEFSEMIDETTEGQHMELSWVLNRNWDVTEEDYLLMVHKKAAWYTCVSPCRLGCIVAGASERILSDVVPFGLNLGAAFQIRDDILNLKADEAKYGKEVGGDLLEGKRTLILIHLLSHCSFSERRAIIRIMNKSREDKRKEEIEYIMKQLKRYKSLEYAEEKASMLASKAKVAFKKISKESVDEGATRMASDLIQFMTKRES